MFRRFRSENHPGHAESTGRLDVLRLVVDHDHFLKTAVQFCTHIFIHRRIGFQQSGFIRDKNIFGTQQFGIADGIRKRRHRVGKNGVFNSLLPHIGHHPAGFGKIATDPAVQFPVDRRRGFSGIRHAETFAYLPAHFPRINFSQHIRIKIICPQAAAGPDFFRIGRSGGNPAFKRLQTVIVNRFAHVPHAVSDHLFSPAVVPVP